jgi:hypothetical protein
VTGTLSPEVAAHAVGHSVELQLIAAQETIFVVLALAANIGDGPASGFHVA